MTREKVDASPLRTILRSGYVHRYHSNPDLARYGDSVAHHHAMVAQILAFLHPDPPVRLLLAALHHDCGEFAVGDLAAPFKRAHPELAAAHAALEAAVLERLGLAWDLQGDEPEWLSFADRLAAWAHIRHVAPWALDGDGWPDQEISMRGASWRLGCAAEVERFFRDWAR